jgi:hypothetical protein
VSRRSAVILGVCAVLIYGIFFRGCLANSRLPKPSGQETKLLSTGPLPFTVAVMPWDEAHPVFDQSGKNPMAYTGRIFHCLDQSRVFKEVRLVDSMTTDTDLVAMSTGRYCNTTVIPYYTGLTLGLYPTVVNDRTCSEAAFSSARKPGAWTRIGVDHTAKSVMGWAAIPLGFWPGWVHGDAAADRRYDERWAIEILKQRHILEHLAGQK